MYGKRGRLLKRSRHNLDEAYLDKAKAIEQFKRLKEQYEKELSVKFEEQDSDLDITGKNENLSVNIFIKDYEFIVNSNEEIEDNVYIFTSRENINCIAVEDLAFANENNANNYNELTLELFKTQARRNWEVFGYNVTQVIFEKDPGDDFYSNAYPRFSICKCRD